VFSIKEKFVNQRMFGQKKTRTTNTEMRNKHYRLLSRVLLLAVFLLGTILSKSVFDFRASAAQITLQDNLKPIATTATLSPITPLLTTAPPSALSSELSEVKTLDEHDQPETQATPGLHIINVKRGDSFFKILERKNISASTGYKILENQEARELLSLLRPHDIIKIEIDDAGQLAKLLYKPNIYQKLFVQKESDTYTFTIEQATIKKRLEFKNYALRQSLFIDGYRESVPPEILQNLMRLYRETAVDIFRLQKNDEISILYEIWIHEKPDGSEEIIKASSILASEIKQNGKTHGLYQFVSTDNTPQYYDSEGLELGSELFQIPVRYKRISSAFNPRRLHPILKYIRPHLGVDLAAPTGTPVVAASDGVVDFAGWRGGYGKTIIIDHGERYSTLYGHLHSYQVKAGEQVKRGQVIGQVGSTGLSTGPHLHYEIRVDGIHRDPMTFSGQPTYIKDEQRAAFVERLAFYQEQMQQPKQVARQNLNETSKKNDKTSQ
jgi:murein DD-endopeptidase MepM/ murein hydrolase activator NlpD